VEDAEDTQQDKLNKCTVLHKLNCCSYRLERTDDDDDDEPSDHITRKQGISR